MKIGTITEETFRKICGLKAAVYVNAGSSIVIEIPYDPEADPTEYCEEINATLEDREELFV